MAATRYGFAAIVCTSTQSEVDLLTLFKSGYEDTVFIK
jgi:hypothetical protein